MHVAFATTYFFTTGDTMEGIKDFPKFIKKLFYDHDISRHNIAINKTQVAILLFIHAHQNKSMSELSRLVGLEKSSFTRSVEQLTRNGFLTKHYQSDDRRVINIAFTEKGEKAVTLIKEDWENYIDSLLAPFTEEERAEFSQAVNTVSRYINRIL